MRELLKKYKNGTLTAPDEQDAFMHELLQIRAERAQTKGRSIIAYEPPSEAIVRPLNVFLRKVANPRYFAAAACILLACFTFWKFNAAEKKPKNELMADIADVTNNLKSMANSTRGLASSTNSALSQIVDLCEKGNYQGVIEQLEGKVPINETEYLYLGLAYLNSEKPDYQKSLDCFKKIQSNDFQQYITMVKALCHIKLNQTDDARGILEQIKNDKQQGNEYREKARRLLDGL